MPINPQWIETRQELTQQLIELFHSGGWSHHRLAQAAGLSSATVNGILYGATGIPQVGTLEAFVKACGQDPRPWTAARGRVVHAEKAGNALPPAEIPAAIEPVAAPREAATGSGDVLNEIDGTAVGAVIQGRDYYGPVSIAWGGPTAWSLTGQSPPTHPSFLVATQGSTTAATAANPPVRIEEVKPLNTAGVGDSRALANKLELSAQELAQVNGYYRSHGGLPSSIHAVPTTAGFTVVTVMGNGQKTVTITGMQVVKEFQEPLTGTLFYCPNQGGESTIGLGFDLDSSIGYAQNVKGTSFYDYSFSGNFFQGNVVTLGPGETHAFSISVRSLLHYCQFTFQMSVATPDGVIIEKIDDNGKPFELTGIATPPVGEAYQNPLFSAYQAVYAGGPANLSRSSPWWIQVDPKTFKGQVRRG